MLGKTLVQIPYFGGEFVYVQMEKNYQRNYFFFKRKRMLNGICLPCFFRFHQNHSYFFYYCFIIVEIIVMPDF